MIYKFWFIDQEIELEFDERITKEQFEIKYDYIKEKEEI